MKTKTIKNKCKYCDKIIYSHYKRIKPIPKTFCSFHCATIYNLKYKSPDIDIESKIKNKCAKCGIQFANNTKWYILHGNFCKNCK